MVYAPQRRHAVASVRPPFIAINPAHHSSARNDYPSDRPDAAPLHTEHAYTLRSSPRANPDHRSRLHPPSPIAVHPILHAHLDEHGGGNAAFAGFRGWDEWRQGIDVGLCWSR